MINFNDGLQDAGLVQVGDPFAPDSDAGAIISNLFDLALPLASGPQPGLYPIQRFRKFRLQQLMAGPAQRLLSWEAVEQFGGAIPIGHRSSRVPDDDRGQFQEQRLLPQRFDRPRPRLQGRDNPAAVDQLF